MEKVMRNEAEPVKIDRRNLICALFPMGINNLNFQFEARDVYDTVVRCNAAQKPIEETAADYPLAFLHLSERTYHAFQYSGCKIETVADLMRIAPDLKRIRGIGKQSLKEIEEALRDFIVKHSG